MNKTAQFTALSELEQARLLSLFAHELTLHARDGYEPGTERLSDPALLRRLNEVQHRVTAAIHDRLSSSRARYPDDVLVRLIAGSDADAFSRRLHAAFCRSW